MKKLHILIPSLIATSCMSLVSLASCNPQSTYTITFELGNGSIEGLTGKTMTVNENTTYGMLPTPKLSGYSFNGWTVDDKDVKSTDVITNDVTVTAKWVKDEDGKFDLTLESDGMLDNSVNEGTTGATFWTIISHHEGYDDGNWIIPDNRIYYDVTVDGKPFYNFEIKKIDIVDEFNYDIMFYSSLVTAQDNMTIKVKPYCKYLTFTVADETKPTDFYLQEEGSVGIDSIRYTYNLTNPDWQTWSFGRENRITLDSEHKQVYLWNPQTTFSSDTYNYLRFKHLDADNTYYCSGNIMSLLNFSNLKKYCFFSLFDTDHYLLSTPTLPSTTIPVSCYDSMFNTCDKLEDVILPAETVEVGCYAGMLYSCNNLKKIKVGFGTKGSRGWPSYAVTASWLLSVSPTGTFIWKGSPEGPETRNKDTVPEGWNIETWE